MRGYCKVSNKESGSFSLHGEQLQVGVEPYYILNIKIY
jgi:hypothetical protein